MKQWQAWCCALVLAVCGGGARAQLLIGQTAGFSGFVASGVRETTDGALLYLDAVNAAGGVHGQKIELISLDDKFSPELAAQNARKLIVENKVAALFLTRGTPHTEAIIPLLNKYGVALVGPSTGAMVLHKPVQKNVFNVRATYQREAEKVIGHLATTGLAQIALLHTDDSFGSDGVTGALKGLRLAKLAPVLVEKFDRARPEFGPIAARLAASGAQAVLMIASGAAVAQAGAALRAAGSRAQIVTLSNNATDGFIKSLGGNARGVIVTQVFPSERSMSYAMVKEARALAGARGRQQISPAMLEGFAAAKVLVEGLRRAGPRPGRDKIRDALEGIRKFDLGGLEISYGPNDHTGLELADLSIIGADGSFRR